MSRVATYLGALRSGPPPVLILAVVLSMLPVTGGLTGQTAGTSGGLEGADAPIFPGDVVRLTVWREESLTDDFPVNQFGTVVLPMVGEYDVSAETHFSLRQKVIRDLQQRLANPSIELVVLKRVRVLGEVREPGVFLLDPTWTVADALATAGGRTPEGREGMVILRREGEAVLTDLRLETRMSDSRIRSGDELVVPREGWLSRNTGPVLGAASALVGLVAVLLR